MFRGRTWLQITSLVPGKRAKIERGEAVLVTLRRKNRASCARPRVLERRDHLVRVPQQCSDSPHTQPRVTLYSFIT
ncbi:hypothetical protein E2C01_038176 [Portunus trituberculatus]|uniref:Uncharacterized protein n=1 Tax=Portunus trituberculatus TaxID=210409 RepID=A0A5B7FHC5_PORTR|nr:hypothetical protein [Portunus trituberculatus]